MLNQKQKETLEQQAKYWTLIEGDTVTIIEQAMTTVVHIDAKDKRIDSFAALNQKLSDGPREYLMFVSVKRPQYRRRFYTR